MLDIAVRLQHALKRNNNTDILEKLIPLTTDLEKALME
jgi:hypothetical protein